MNDTAKGAPKSDPLAFRVADLRDSDALVSLINSAFRVEQPFTAWHDPHDPYQLLVEAFAASVLDGTEPPRSLQDSIGTARLMDQVRLAATVTR